MIRKLLFPLCFILLCSPCHSEAFLSNALGQTVTARFLCTVDNLGTEINNMFMKDGHVDLDRDGVEEDIELAADMLYNNIRYIVME